MEKSMEKKVASSQEKGERAEAKKPHVGEAAPYEAIREKVKEISWAMANKDKELEVARKSGNETAIKILSQEHDQLAEIRQRKLQEASKLKEHTLERRAA